MEEIQKKLATRGGNEQEKNRWFYKTLQGWEDKDIQIQEADNILYI
jgi:hypothetical protein